MLNRTSHIAVLLIAVFLHAGWLSSYSGGAEPETHSARELVSRLRSYDEATLVDAERRLFRLKGKAAGELLQATCGVPIPRENIVAATLRILRGWEEESWTNRESAAALARFVELARDNRNTSGQDVPLGPKARDPFVDAVRVLDVTPDAAAAYLRAKPGIDVSKDEYGYYGSVELKSRWVVEPKDWLYIANLARHIGASGDSEVRHPIQINVIGELDSATLAECIRYLRKSIDTPINVYLQQATLDRECLVLLQSYHELQSLSADSWSDAITDEDWATSIVSWPKCVSLRLSPTAGRQAIAAAAKLPGLLVLDLKNAKLTEADVTPLRGHKTLNMLRVWDEDMGYVEYLNQRRTGKWQVQDP